MAGFHAKAGSFGAGQGRGARNTGGAIKRKRYNGVDAEPARLGRELLRMNPATPATELMYELDSLYVGTEMIIGGKFRMFPLDGLLLEVCLLHFRVVWDFFYRPKYKPSDIVVGDFIPQWTEIPPPPRLVAIRKWLNVFLAHLTTERTDPALKAGEITMADVEQIRTHTKTLFDAFISGLTRGQRCELVNPHARKFSQYETLNPLV